MTSVLEYHTLTAHEPDAGARVATRPDSRLVRFRRMDPVHRPPQTKTYEGLERIPLPEDIDRDRPSRLLFGSAGVVRVTDRGGEPLFFRAAGSAGNLHPLEIYVLWDGWLSHYDPPAHALERLRPIPAGTPPAFIVTGVPWRTGWKYAERGFRHLYWDAGSMLAQTLALEPRARIEMGFADREVAALLGADGTHEFPLAVVGLDGEIRLPEPEEVPRGFLARDPIEFPLVTAVQRAGDLEAPASVEGWRASRTSEAPDPAAAGRDAETGGPWTPPGDIMDLIRRRGSTRTFDPARTGPRDLLAEAIRWASGRVPWDLTEATLLEHNLAVHAIEGIEPGAYHWPSATPLRAGLARRDAKILCLAQDLGGDGCYTVFHSADLETLDARRYRAAHLEAGIVSGRLHLAAVGLGFGATGLTFFDDLVRGFFETRAWPLLVTAVGSPAYRSRPGGIPRAPTRLRL